MSDQEEDAEQMQSTHIQPEGLNGFFAPAGFHTQPVERAFESPKKKRKKSKQVNESLVVNKADTSMQDASLADANPAKGDRSEKKKEKKKRKSDAQ